MISSGNTVKPRDITKGIWTCCLDYINIKYVPFDETNYKYSIKLTPNIIYLLLVELT